jgi:hypothetical protein
MQQTVGIVIPPPLRAAREAGLDPRPQAPSSSASPEHTAARGSLSPRDLAQAKRMTRISVMQPYFLPYAGYFRLMCNVDVFVVLDVVQFPRGGWVHRNQLRTYNNSLGWFTLPLARPRLGTPITALRFRSTAADDIRRAVRRFPAANAPVTQTKPLLDVIMAIDHDPVVLLTRLLELIRDLLDLRVTIVRASELVWTPPSDRLERIVSLCRHFNASSYINAPGGRALYDATTFKECGIDLQFLADYRGPHDSILQRLHDSPVSELRREILANLA